MLLHSTFAIFVDMKLIELNLQRIIDLLVDFEPIDHATFDYVGNYFDLRDALERLFNRPVDLIEYGCNLNPLFKASVDKKKQMIYG